MTPYTVIYINESESAWLQFFLCRADDADHAEEQCVNAYPDCHVVEVNKGRGLEAHAG